MRRSVIPLLLLCLNAYYNSTAQNQTKFDQSIDPSSLSTSELTQQLDTSNQYRKAIALAVVRDEFEANALVQVETYYRKSDQHLLLEMSKGVVPLQNTYVVSEGLGTTFWKISDGICWVLLTQNSFIDEPGELQVRERSCAE